MLEKDAAQHSPSLHPDTQQGDRWWGWDSFPIWGRLLSMEG